VPPNALSYSSIGLKGVEEILSGLSVVFNLQTTFLPTSGRLSDGPKSMIDNNGVPLDKQTTNADSSRAGQAFNSEAFGGLSSQLLGTLTFGRVNALTLDGVIAYDPQTASNAFSVIGWSGVAAGMGDTEDARLDDSLKYVAKIGPVRLSALYQFPGTGRESRTAYEFGLGGDIRGLSLDAIYSKIDDAISAGPLSASQVLKAPTNSLSATVSDNTSVMLLARYTAGPIVLDGGYEHIQFDNPSDPLLAGSQTIGGYTLGVINNTAYTRNRVFQIFWTGGTYHATKKLKLSLAYYHEWQNSYKGNGCSNSSFGSCSGDLDAVSLVADYQFWKYLDGYTGVMYSKVAGGLQSGYLHNNTIDPTIGLRLKF
jgi:predicted porin